MFILVTEKNYPPSGGFSSTNYTTKWIRSLEIL